MYKKIISRIFTAALLWSGFAIAQNKLLPLDPAVRTGKLPNGFTYYIRHNEEPKGRVIFYLANKVGSVLENDDQRGLAHFMEHMSFNGTKHFPKNELVDYLQRSGVRFGADLNAYTSFDETVYELPLPTDKPELLQSGIGIMRDWAQEATLDPVEIDKERGVVLEEKRLGKGAGERMQRQYWPVILNQSRYATRIPIGVDTVLNHFKPEAIRSFYHDWYRPDLQALIVVGDINVDEIEKTIIAKFSDLKNPAHERKRTRYTVPLNGENHFMVVTDPEMTSTVAEILIKQPELPLHTAAEYRKNIIRELFNNMIGERYAEVMRESDPPFLRSGASFQGFLGGIDNFNATVVAKPGELERGYKAMWREIERVRRFGFTATELDRARQSYLSRMQALLDEKGKTNSASYVQEYLEYFLKGTASPGIAYEFDLVKNDLPGITLNEVNALASAAITSVNRDILILAPDKDRSAMPAELQVLVWMKQVEAENLQPYQDNISTLPLLTKKPVAGTIISETKDDRLKITTLVLSNGVKVLLKPTDFKNDEIVFSGFSGGGTSLYSDADFQSANSAAGIIASFGAGNYDSNQLAKFLSGKQMSVQPYINERFQGFNGSAQPKDLETDLQLLYAYFTEPRKDTAMFKGIIARNKAGLANRASDPNSVFRDTVSAVLGNYNVRRTGPSLAKLDQVNLDRAYEIYRERFSDASSMTFTFVGSFDVDKIKPLLATYLGALPATHSAVQARDLGIHMPEGRIEKSVLKGSEPKATVVMFWSGTFDYGQEQQVALDALKECLEIRLLERLREDESGVYSPGTFVDVAKYPQARYAFIVQFGCAPQNADKLVASTLDEIEKLKNEGPPQVNVDKWRAETLRTRETESRNNNWWLGYLTGQLKDDENLYQLESYPGTLQQVTPEELKKAANKYLSGKNFIRMQLLPEHAPKS